MKDQLAVIPNAQLPARLTKEDVKQYLCPLANDSEIFMFLNICQEMNLSPFKNGEIFLIKYSSTEKAQIVVGYRTYLKRAEASGQLEYWSVEVADDISSATITIKRRDWTKEFNWTVDANELGKITSPKSPMFGKEKFRLKKTVMARGFALAFPNDAGILPYIPEELPATAEYVSSESLDSNMPVEKEPATDVPFFDGRYEEKGTVPQNHPDAMKRNIQYDDIHDAANDITHQQKLDDDALQPEHTITDPSTEEETAEPSEEFVPKDKEACFAIAEKLGITDVLMKQECLETFTFTKPYPENGDTPVEEPITSRTQMNPEQWKTYREILEQRQEFRKFHETYVASGIPLEHLDTYLCIRFSLPSIRLVERYRCDDATAMLEQSIEKNKMDKFTAAVAQTNTWINRKSIGRTGAFNLLENLYRLSVELDDPELSYQVVKEFYKNMKIMKEDPRLSNILASLFTTWQEALKKACSAHNVNFDVIIEPDLDATEDMQTKPEADGIEF